MADSMQLDFIVNGEKISLIVNPAERLLDILRKRLSLTGTKEGCSEGECGACTVILNGKIVNSCLVLAIQLTGAEVETIEGLASDKLHALQEAFIEAGAVQCGYCTPGMILAAKALLESKPQPTLQDIKEGLSGNLCRCTGYQQIFHAVENAAKRLQQKGDS